MREAASEIKVGFLCSVGLCDKEEKKKERFCNINKRKLHIEEIIMNYSRKLTFFFLR